MNQRKRHPITRKQPLVNTARVTKITQTMRMAVKIRDNFYTVEYQEERALPNLPSIDLEQEKSILFDSCRDNIYKQVQEIVDGLS